jgi:hypothetical protein
MKRNNNSMRKYREEARGVQAKDIDWNDFIAEKSRSYHGRT